MCQAWQAFGLFWVLGVCKAVAKVQEVAARSLGESLKGTDLALVYLHSPRCAHCEAFEEIFLKASNALDAVPFISTDGTEVHAHDDAGMFARIRGVAYPSVLLFNKGVPLEYHGERSVDALLAWVNSRIKSGPGLQRLESAAALSAFLEDTKGDGKVAVVGVPQSAGDSALAAALDGVAWTYDGKIPVALAEVDPAAANKLLDPDGRGGNPKTVAVTRPFRFEVPIAWAPDYSSPDALFNFVEYHQHPRLIIASAEQQAELYESMEPGEGQAVLFADESEVAQLDAIKAYASIAVETTDPRLRFVWAKPDNYGKAVGSMMFIHPEDYPILAIKEFGKDLDSDKVWRMEDIYGKSFALADMKSFIQTWLKGEAKVQETGVVELTSKNFKEVTMDRSKDVFVQVYEAGCGACRAMKPIWAQLGRRYLKDDSVIIAQLNLAKNPVLPKIEIYPELLLYPKSSKHPPKKFRGKHDLVVIQKFLQEGIKKKGKKAAQKNVHDEM